MVTCSVISALNANARKNSCSRSQSKFETRPRATGTLKTRNGRPDRSTAADTSVSSIGIDAVPKRTMPRLSPSACERLAKDDADVLDGVVLIDVDVPLRLDGEVHEPVLGERLEHVAEERDRRRDLRRAGAVEPQRQRDLRLFGLALHARQPSLAHWSPPWRSALRCRLVRASAALPWAVSPSIRDSVVRCGSAAASPDGVYSRTLERFTKSSVPSGDAKRAVPAVGKT